MKPEQWQHVMQLRQSIVPEQGGIEYVMDQIHPVYNAALLKLFVYDGEEVEIGLREAKYAIEQSYGRPALPAAVIQLFIHNKFFQVLDEQLLNAYKEQNWTDFAYFFDFLNGVKLVDMHVSLGINAYRLGADEAADAALSKLMTVQKHVNTDKRYVQSQHDAFLEIAKIGQQLLEEDESGRHLIQSIVDTHMDVIQTAGVVPDGEYMVSDFFTAGLAFYKTIYEAAYAEYE